MQITTEELKIRQLTNQFLLAPSDKQTVVRALCGLQAQFLTNAVHALRIRTRDFSEETLSEGLVKNWTVRGTVHVFSETDLPLFLNCENGTSYRKNEWGGYTFWNRRERWALTPERQKYFAKIVCAAASERPHTRDELKTLCRAHGMTAAEESSMFEAWGGGMRELCERGFLNYAVTETKTFVASPPFTPIPEEEAKLEIARLYFTNYGPATVRDASYYTGAPQSEVKAWLKRLPVEAVECGGKTYFYLPSGRTYGREIPPCLFLAGFDPLMLGYQKKESLYLPEEHLRGIFNLAGIVMPAILLRGRVIGKWKKKGTNLLLTLFEPLSESDRSLLAETAERLWSAPVAVRLEEGGLA